MNCIENSVQKKPKNRLIRLCVFFVVFVHKKHLFSETPQLRQFFFLFFRTTCQNLASTCPVQHNLSGEKNSSSFRDTRKFDVLRHLLSCELGLQLGLHEHSPQLIKKSSFSPQLSAKACPYGNHVPRFFKKILLKNPQRNHEHKKKSLAMLFASCPHAQIFTSHISHNSSRFLSRTLARPWPCQVQGLVAI